MTAHFRIIYYSSDPIVGGRVPIGSVVRAGQRVDFVPAGHLPSAACLGSTADAVAVQMLLALFDQPKHFDSLPGGAGPYAELGESRPVPHGVDNALDWVGALLAVSTPKQDGDRKAPRTPRRASIGYRFFETWAVAKHVRKTFRPDADWGGRLGRYAELPQISHWVASKDTVLLLEPVVAGRRQFDEDVTEIAQRFMSYQWALRKEQAIEGRLLAYVPSGGRPERRAEAIERLSPYADVFDTENGDQRDSLLAAIRRVGQGDQRSLLH